MVAPAAAARHRVGTDRPPPDRPGVAALACPDADVAAGRRPWRPGRARSLVDRLPGSGGRDRSRRLGANDPGAGGPPGPGGHRRRSCLRHRRGPRARRPSLCPGHRPTRRRGRRIAGGGLAVDDRGSGHSRDGAQCGRVGSPYRRPPAPVLAGRRPVVTIDEVRALASLLPRSYEALVRDRVKFRVGRIVYLAFSRDESLMGFAFPKTEREALVASEPDKFLMPPKSDLRYAGRSCGYRPSTAAKCANWWSMHGGWWCPNGWRPSYRSRCARRWASQRASSTANPESSLLK